MKRSVLFAALFMAVGCLAGAVAEKPLEAKSVMDTATKHAKSQKKPIWLLFDASW